MKFIVVVVMIKLRKIKRSDRNTEKLVLEVKYKHNGASAFSRELNY